MDPILDTIRELEQLQRQQKKLYDATLAHLTELKTKLTKLSTPEKLQEHNQQASTNLPTTTGTYMLSDVTYQHGDIHADKRLIDGRFSVVAKYYATTQQMYVNVQCKGKFKISIDLTHEFANVIRKHGMMTTYYVTCIKSLADGLTHWYPMNVLVVHTEDDTIHLFHVGQQTSSSPRYMGYFDCDIPRIKHISLTPETRMKIYSRVKIAMLKKDHYYVYGPN